MFLYTYVRKPHTVLTEGIKTPLTADESRLFHYAARAESEKKKDILLYLESVFIGRSRAVSCLTEQAPETDNPKIRGWAESCDCFAFDPAVLEQSSLIETFWRLDGNLPVQISREQIDSSSLPWESVDPYDNVFFKRIPHYMLVLKDGVLPPEFLFQAARFRA